MQKKADAGAAYTNFVYTCTKFYDISLESMANKKHLVASFHNLSPELQEEIKQKYPLGFTDAMIRVDKPNGDFFYAVPFDTEDVSYLVKIDVKIDDLSEDEEDKEYYDDEIKGADDLQDESSQVEEPTDDDVDI